VGEHDQAPGGDQSQLEDVKYHTQFGWAVVTGRVYEDMINATSKFQRSGPGQVEKLTAESSLQHCDLAALDEASIIRGERSSTTNGTKQRGLRKEKQKLSVFVGEKRRDQHRRKPLDSKVISS